MFKKRKGLTKKDILLGQKRERHIPSITQKIKRKARFCSTNSLLEYKVLFSICWLATNLMCDFFRSWCFLLTETKLDLTLFLIRHLLKMQYNQSGIWVSRLLRLVLEV